MDKKKALFCWSGGKDSALALYKILRDNEYNVVSLLTTVNEEFKRVSMHGVREELLELQAKEIGIPLKKMYIRKDSSNEDYEKSMETVLKTFKEVGVEYVIFGDIFLEDLKKYREDNLGKVGLKAVFPLWKMDTAELIREFLTLGFKTIVCCTNNDFFDDQYVGKIITAELIASLPSRVDPCGENGEFHTFTFEGPIFKSAIPVKTGEKVLKTYEAKCMNDGEKQVEVKGYWFIDLLV